MRRQEGDDHDPVVSILDDSDSDANALKPAENPQVSRVTLHNVAHRHFPWCRFRARLTAAVGRKGKCQFSASTTESDDEPIMGSSSLSVVQAEYRHSQFCAAASVCCVQNWRHTK